MNSHRKRKIIVYFLIPLLVFAVVWIAGDFAYSKYIDAQLAKWEDTVTRDANGVQDGCQAYTTGQGSTALLLVHGFNDTPRAYDFMASPLAEKGYTVRVMRMDGFGVPVDQMRDCTADQWVGNVRAEVRKLKESHDRVFIVAHSLGGAVTLSFMTSHPELIDGVALLAPAVDVANNRSPVLPTRTWRKIGDRLLFFSDTYLSPYNRNDARDPEVQNPPEKPPFSTRNIVKQTFRLIEANADQASHIKMPVLMVLTRDDQIVDWIAAEKFFHELASEKKRLKFYDSSGHALTVDYDRDKIVQDIDQFVQECIAQP